LIGYVPWQFHMIPAGSPQESAWKKLMNRDGFFADFGPTTVERNDPMFLLQKSCCWWSGQSWPYATSQTLKALAHLLQDAQASRTVPPLTARDYVTLLNIFARSHRKDGKPYLAEALHPDTGSFEGHDGYNHSEHYFHSSFNDLVITGLVGLIPRDDSTLELRPLAPADWDYFAIDQVPYRGHRIGVVWDRTGNRYKQSAGLSVLVDGIKVHHSSTLSAAVIEGVVPDIAIQLADSTPVPVNYAVNNDGGYYPRITASHTGAGSSPSRLIDGNVWYHVHPPNRWTTSANDVDELILDLGIPRRVDTAKLYFLDDPDQSGTGIRAPASCEVQTWKEDHWETLAELTRSAEHLAGHRPDIVRFPEQEVTRLRLLIQPQQAAFAGMTELEVWGDAVLPVDLPGPPKDNLAWRHPDSESPFPRVTASHTSRFDKVEMANDGRIVFSPNPHNRWTSYESKTPTDWLQVEFGEPKQFRELNLYLYDDRGGVQPPESFTIEYRRDGNWQAVAGATRIPPAPTGSMVNTVRFEQVTSDAVRVIFTHRGQARSGVTEIEVRP
ncbi:MAG: discoidin domain-containing protein, partial [Planctomycetaceae bacterium]|nr:discoidin domain-containing protein [Planctomycetaceae bacterium]